MRRWITALWLSALVVLPGCAQRPNGYADFKADVPYSLASGDRLRVIVFGQDALSNTYAVNSGGNISMPLIGSVRAQGLTTAGLERSVESKLRDGFIRDPKVSIEVDSFRPFFVLGEVTTAGQYPYIAGMTAETAVAVAGGYTPRANKFEVDLTRVVDGHPVTASVPVDQPVKPGDTIFVRERFFLDCCAIVRPHERMVRPHATQAAHPARAARATRRPVPPCRRSYAVEQAVPAAMRSGCSSTDSLAATANGCAAANLAALDSGRRSSASGVCLCYASRIPQQPRPCRSLEAFRAFSRFVDQSQARCRAWARLEGRGLRPARRRLHADANGRDRSVATPPTAAASITPPAPRVHRPPTWPSRRCLCAPHRRVPVRKRATSPRRNT